MKNYMDVLTKWVELDAQFEEGFTFQSITTAVTEIVRAPGFQMVADRYECKTKATRRELAHWMLREKCAGRQPWYI